MDAVEADPSSAGCGAGAVKGLLAFIDCRDPKATQELLPLVNEEPPRLAAAKMFEVVLPMQGFVALTEVPLPGQTCQPNR